MSAGPADAGAPPTRLVGIGTFCITRWIIDSAQRGGPTLPFDDLFSSPAIVTQALDDDFAVFLNHDDYLPAMNSNSWVQRLYRERFGQENTFAHHDMREEDNRRKFERRVARFRALPNDTIFVLIGWAHQISNDGLTELGGALRRRFPAAGLVAIAMGGGEAPPQIVDAALPAVRFDMNPISSIDGICFADHRDNERLAASIEEGVRRLQAMRPHPATVTAGPAARIAAWWRERVGGARRAGG